MPPASATDSSPRLPAEWEPQDGILLVWPTHRDIWEPDVPLADVQRVHTEIIAQVSARERVVVLTADPLDTFLALEEAGAMQPSVTVVNVRTDDLWIRDFGPLTVLAGGGPSLLDFTYNGWGGKYPAGLDTRATEKLHERGVFGELPRRALETILEGGSLETDGKGRLLTTASCLLTPTRNPSLDREATTALLRRELGVGEVLWLDHGWLDGDDTDGHVDMLARFTPAGPVLHTACTDSADPHREPLEAMRRQLAELLPGRELMALPIPPAIHAPDGHRLPASYANFLVINGAVLVPTYRHEASDRAALEAIAATHPGREVVPIDATPLIHQHGSIHCATMQLPKGTLANLS